MTSPSAPTKWHLAKWPFLAWLETGFKAAGQVLAVIALVQALSHVSFMLPIGSRLVQWTILVILSLGLTMAIWDRIQSREIFSLVFIVTNNIAHWGLVLALMSGQGPGGYLIGFAVLYLVGDLVKLYFIRRERFTVRNYSQATLYALTGSYVLGYALILLLELL